MEFAVDHPEDPAVVRKREEDRAASLARTAARRAARAEKARLAAEATKRAAEAADAELDDWTFGKKPPGPSRKILFPPKDK